MTRRTWLKLGLVILVVLPWGLLAQKRSARGDLRHVNYARAEEMLTWNTTPLIAGAAVEPHWLADGSRFWYRRATSAGWDFVLVDPARDVQEAAFDHHRVAAALGRVDKTVPSASRLPIDDLNLDARTATGRTSEKRVVCDLARYECSAGDIPPARRPSHILSPDGRWEAFTDRYNLYIRPASAATPSP